MNILPNSLVIILGIGLLGCTSSSDTKESASASLAESPLESPAESLVESPVESPVESNEQHKEDVGFLREEEKLARDVYKTLYQKWNMQIFQNISESEQRHMDRMGQLIQRYGIDDPVKDDTVGVFTNAELQKLYNYLVASGNKSEVDALVVGATIEDLDIRDIRTMRKNTSDSEALDAFAKLECGSRNHMRAFTQQLAQRGGTYTAQYLSAEDIESIVSGDNEKCGQGGKGQGGQGRGGQGRGQGGQGHGGGGRR